MRCFKIMMFIFGLFFVTCDAMAQQPHTINLTMEDNGKEVELAPGETITLQLKEPGATGAAWYMDDVDESHLKLMGQERVNPSLPQKFEGGPVPGGGPSVRFWTFRAVAPGDTVLRLLLYRVWEGKEHAADKFEVKLHITGTSEKSNEPNDEIQKEVAGAKPGRSLDIYFNGREIKVDLGAIITVELKAQDETGADWYIDGLDQSRLKLIGKKAISVSPKVVAEGPVFKKWFFKTISSGDTTLKLLYYLPSEGKEHATSTFEVKLHIADK